jgi:hypothetical protein
MTTTDFSQIIFNEQAHTYSYRGHWLTGANRKIKELQKPFEREKVAQRVADRDRRRVEDVLMEWDLKGEIGRQRGNAVHQHIMKVLTGGNGPVDDPLLVVDDPLPEIKAFNRVWSSLSNRVEVRPDFVEWVIGDADMGVAGMLDTMFLSRETGLWHIWDWKTGKFETNNRFQRLKPPFDDLDDCQLQVFSLVTSLYRLMVERNRPDLQLGECYLVHLNSYGSYTVHTAFDYRARLFAWLDIPLNE